MAALEMTAINTWVNGTPLKALLGAENGNGCHSLMQREPVCYSTGLNSTEGQRRQWG